MFIYENVDDLRENGSILPNTIVKGECLEVMNYIPDNSIDMVLCDLPFGTTKCKWDIPISLNELWQQYKRIVKPNGAILLFAQTPFDKVLGSSNLPQLRYEWIWEKTQATGFLNAKKMPMKAHENVLVFYDKLPTYNPIKTQGHVRKVSSSSSRKKSIDRRKERHGDDYIYGEETITDSYDSTERYPRSVLTFPSDKQTSSLHPTQKPLALCEYFIKTYTNEGEVVLDNTAGSFTTAVAADNTNRKYIVIEKEDKYFSIGKERVMKNKRI